MNERMEDALRKAMGESIAARHALVNLSTVRREVEHCLAKGYSGFDGQTTWRALEIATEGKP